MTRDTGGGDEAPGRVPGARGDKSGAQVVSPAARAEVAGAQVACFTAPSTFERYLALGLPLPPVLACIGPVTAATAAEHGVPVTIVATEHTVDGLVDALVAVLRC